MANRIKWTPEKREIFLEELRKCPNVTEAAKLVGISHTWVYELRGRDENFRAEWDAAVDVGVGVLEAEMWRRAVEGTEKPVYQQGKEVGRIREYSDVLAIFLAKGHRPEKYRDRHEVSGPNGGPIQTENKVVVYLPDNGRPDTGKEKKTDG